MRAQALFAFCMAQQQPSFSVCSVLQANAQTSPGFAGRPAAICNAVRPVTFYLEYNPKLLRRWAPWGSYR